MRHLFVLIFGLAVSTAVPAAAQLTDLFEDEDFQSSEIEQMQQREAERKKAEKAEKAEKTEKPARPPVSESAPSARTVAPKPSQTSRSQPQPPVKAEPVPAVGASSSQEKLPDLGSRSRQTVKKNDEGLSLFEMRSKKTGGGSTDVLKFDIAGVMLKMTPEEVAEHAREAGFELAFQEKKVPKLNEWRYARVCLKKNLFQLRAKDECVREQARGQETEYVSRQEYENRELREKMTVEFADNSVGNGAFRIFYINRGDASLGATDEAHYLKTMRRQEFLRRLITKYGSPDDEQALLWGMGGLSATMQADMSESQLDATLILEDVSLKDKADENMAQADAKRSAPDAFGF